MDRRDFVKTCTLGAGLLAGGGMVLAGNEQARPYQRVQLLNPDGSPLRASELTVGEQQVFHYPFAATPCFLIKLGRPLNGRAGLSTESGQLYDWPGGVGAERNIVAYSAICAHKMAHPTPSVSYISYRPARTVAEPADGVIMCCAEESRYDPAAGASVLDGPAPQPLATILLEHAAEDDALYATGVLGGEMFQRFFTEFALRLSLENPSRDQQAPLTEAQRVMPLSRYSNNVLSC